MTEYYEDFYERARAAFGEGEHGMFSYAMMNYGVRALRKVTVYRS